MSNGARYDGGVREERQQEDGEEEEEESPDYVNERPPRLRARGHGSQRTAPPKSVQRAIVRACAACLTMLFLVLAVRTIDKTMDCLAATNQSKTDYNNLTLNLIQTKYDILMQDNVTQLQTKPSKVKSCPSGWKKFGDSCYYTSTERKTWEESRAQCLQTGADLVIIDSEEEQEFIKGLTRNGDTWIGLKRTEGKWTWVDGTPLTTTQYWASEYPDNDEYEWNCAYYYWNLGWYNHLCPYERYHICEK